MYGRLKNHRVRCGPVTIVQVMNPTVYWVKCTECISTEEMQHILQRYHLTNASDIQRGQRLILKQWKGLLYRVIVQDTAPIACMSQMVKVFFIDLMSVLVVESSQLYHCSSKMIMDRVPQLHLVGIQDAFPIVNPNPGFPIDEVDIESQRREIMKELTRKDRVEFYPEKYAEHVTFGKVRVFKTHPEYTQQNFLSYLASRCLARYVPNFTQSPEMLGWMNSLVMEKRAIEEHLYPPLVRVTPQPVVNSTPPAAVYDQASHLNQWQGNTNCLDKIVPEPVVETFEEMNQRYRMLSRKQAFPTEGTPVGAVTKNSSNTATSSEDYGTSSDRKATSSSLMSSEESDLLEKKSQERELPRKTTNKRVTFGRGVLIKECLRERCQTLNSRNADVIGSAGQFNDADQSPSAESNVDSIAPWFLHNYDFDNAIKK